MGPPIVGCGGGTAFLPETIVSSGNGDVTIAEKVAWIAATACPSPRRTSTVPASFQDRPFLQIDQHILAPHLVFVFTLTAAATVFALLEIQIEGSAGWARNLPTWRLDNRWTKLLFGSRPLTGYHLYVHLFVLLLLHLPFLLFLVPLTGVAELRILSFLILFWVLEDFLWFIFNRDFGLRRFRKETISWHAPSWWWIMPREYWVFTPLGIALYVLSWSV